MVEARAARLFGDRVEHKVAVACARARHEAAARASGMSVGSASRASPHKAHVPRGQASFASRVRVSALRTRVELPIVLFRVLLRLEVLHAPHLRRVQFGGAVCVACLACQSTRRTPLHPRAVAQHIEARARNGPDDHAMDERAARARHGRARRSPVACPRGWTRNSSFTAVLGGEKCVIARPLRK